MLYNNTNSINKTTPSDVGSIKGGLTTITKGTRKMAASDSTTKTCTKCKESKPATLEYFSPDHRRKSGMQSQCRDCRNQHMRKLYNTPEYREKHSQYSRQKRCLDNAYAERERKYLRSYRHKYPAKYKAWVNIRRIRRLATGEIILPFDEQAQFKRQKSRCYYCQCKLTEYHVEHCVPLSRGGSDHPDNKVLACPSCNMSKNAKLPHEWVKGGRLL